MADAAVQAFATAHLQRKDALQDHRDALRPVAHELREVRAELAKILKDSGASALKVDGGKCVRGRTMQSKRRLTERMVEDAVDDIDPVEELQGLR